MTKRKEALIQQVMKNSSSENAVDEFFRSFFGIYVMKYPDTTKERFAEIFSKYGRRYIEDGIVKIYDKLFTDDELEQILKFIISPLGKKLHQGSFAEERMEFAKELDEKLKEEFEKNAIPQS